MARKRYTKTKNACFCGNGCENIRGRYNRPDGLQYFPGTYDLYNGPRSLRWEYEQIARCQREGLFSERDVAAKALEASGPFQAEWWEQDDKSDYRTFEITSLDDFDDFILATYVASDPDVFKPADFGLGKVSPEKRERAAKRFEDPRVAEAREYVANYTGTFAFLLDIKSRLGAQPKALRIRWTPKLVAAVLRCKEREQARTRRDPSLPSAVDLTAGEADDASMNNTAQDAHTEALEFVRSYTGNFGLILDIKSRGITSLSPRQVEVILASKKRDAEYAARRSTGAGSILAAKDGWYEVDGQVVKVQKAVHGSGNLYAKRLVVEGLEADRHGAHWEYVPGLVRKCNDTNRLSLERAQEMGRLYGVCVVCGAILTDETSIANGIGPICGGRLAA